MDKLILSFLHNKPEGETGESICKDVIRFFKLGPVQIGDHLDDMVDSGVLQFFHVGNSPRYAISK